MSAGNQTPGFGAFDFEKLKIREVFDSLTEGVYITDLDRRILFWNRRAEEITGWKADQIVGRHCRDNILCHADAFGRQLCGDDLCPLKRAMETKSHSISPQKIYAKTPDNKRICVSVSVAPLLDDNGSVIGGIEVFRDETAAEHQQDFAVSVQQSLYNFDEFEDDRVQIDFISEPAEYVNGDYCNVFRLNQDIFGLVVCDVMGHGIASALVATMIHSFFAENMGLWVEPSSMLSNLNERICSLSGQRMSATATIVMVNLATGELIASHAGAPPVVVVRDAEMVFVGKEGGLPCGMFDGQIYEQESFKVRSGDRILLYSDGALEVKTDYDSLLGYEGLYEMFKEICKSGTENCLDVLKAKIVRSSREVRLQDDFTIVFAKLY